METFMDEVKVVSAVNQGTKVRMVKYIRSSINKIGRSE
jgi:hypothetical protein